MEQDTAVKNAIRMNDEQRFVSLSTYRRLDVDSHCLLKDVSHLL